MVPAWDRGRNDGIALPYPGAWHIIDAQGMLASVSSLLSQEQMALIESFRFFIGAKKPDPRNWCDPDVCMNIWLI